MIYFLFLVVHLMMKGFVMLKENLQKDDIINYIHPEFEVLKAFFLSLNLKESFITLDILQSIFKFEVNQNFNSSAKPCKNSK